MQTFVFSTDFQRVAVRKKKILKECVFNHVNFNDEMIHFLLADKFSPFLAVSRVHCR